MKKQVKHIKKWSAVAVSIAFVLGLSGCEANQTGGSMTIKEYLAKYDLEDQISLKFDISDIKDYTKAKIYEAEYWDFNVNEVKATLLHYPQISETVNGTFSIYTTQEGNSDESLVFSNQEETNDPQDNAKGGFEYYHHFNQNFSLENYYPFYPKEILNGTNYSVPALIANPKSWRDLEFASYKSAMEDIETVFEELHFPEYKCQDVTTLDLEALTRSYRYSEEQNLKEPSLFVPIQPLKENETYILQYRQILDGIPVANYLGYQDPQSSCRRSTISVAYTKDGISNLYVNGLLQVNEGDEQDIINASKAASILANYLKDNVYQDNLSLESFELIYHAMMDPSTGKLTVSPFWMIRASEPFSIDLDIPVNSNTSYHTLSYRYFFINAVSGELSADYPKI